jgi:UDP-N-acetylmuramyl pentapeptide phosphotransferase/UDP-N-acetylglucosamine-1-phosphate transferase
MKNLLFASILMIILGVVALTYQGITYTTREKAIDIGPLQITAERTHTLPLLPVLGGIAIVGGVVLFLASRRTT